MSVSFPLPLPSRPIPLPQPIPHVAYGDTKKVVETGFEGRAGKIGAPRKSPLYWIQSLQTVRDLPDCPSLLKALKLKWKRS